MVHSKCQSIWSRNPDQPSFNLKLLKSNWTLKHINNYESVYLVHPFFLAALLKCNKNAVFSFKNTLNEEKGPLLFEK